MQPYGSTPNSQARSFVPSPGTKLAGSQARHFAPYARRQPAPSSAATLLAMQERIDNLTLANQVLQTQLQESRSRAADSEKLNTKNERLAQLVNQQRNLIGALSTQNAQLGEENTQLWEKNAQLREENEWRQEESQLTRQNAEFLQARVRQANIERAFLYQAISGLESGKKEQRQRRFNTQPKRCFTPSPDYSEV